MGHAYLDLLRRGQLNKCAKSLGYAVDTLENQKRTSFAVKPNEEDTGTQDSAS